MGEHMKIAAIIVIVVCLLNIIQPVIGETVVPVYPIRNGQRLSILEDLAYDMSADYRDMLTYGWTPEAAEKEMIAVYTVSYTHLTLPTNREV